MSPKTSATRVLPGCQFFQIPPCIRIAPGLADLKATATRFQLHVMILQILSRHLNVLSCLAPCCHGGATFSLSIAGCLRVKRANVPLSVMMVGRRDKEDKMQSIARRDRHQCSIT